MKKAIILLLSLWFLSGITRLSAQNFALGVRGGISIPNLSSSGQDKSPISKGYSSTLRPDAALFGEYFFPASNFSLRAMLAFSGQGGKKNGLQAFPGTDIISSLPPNIPPSAIPTYLYANFDSKAKMDYLMIPIMGKYNHQFGQQSPWSVYGEVGPFVSFLMGAKHITRGTSEIFLDEEGKISPAPDQTNSFDANTDTRDELHKANVGISGNVGFAYRLNRSFLFIEGGGNYGFIKIQKDKQFGSNNTGAATVDLGYGYRF